MGVSVEPARRYPQRLAAARAGFSGDVEGARRLLDHEDPTTRARALGALARCGALDESTHRTALGDSAPAVRRRAVQLALGLDPVPDLTDALRDADPSVVRVACETIGETVAGVAAVVELIRITGSHDDALCREAAVAALGACGDPAGLDAVLAACSDVVAIRRRAVLMLAAWDDPRCDAMLRELTEDRDRQVRQAAADLLAID